MNYQKEYKKYLISAILDNANNKIANTTLMVAFAVYLGIPSFWIGIYVLLDEITNIIQIFAAPLFAKIGQGKKVVLTNYTIYRIASISFIFIPFLTSNIGLRTVLFFIPAIIYAVTGELGYITFVNWRMSLIKKEDREKFTATKFAFKNTIVLMFSFFMGGLLDYFKGQGTELAGYVILFIIVFVIAFIDIFIRWITYKPVLKQEPIMVKESIQMPMKDKRFRNTIIFCGIYRFAIGIGTVFLNVYILRYLNISYIYYSSLNIVLALSEAFSGLFWSKKIKNRNWKKLLIPMAIIYIISFSMLIFINDTVIFYVLPIVYLFIGCGNAVYDLYSNIAIYENSKKGYETSYVTFVKFIEGIVTTCIPLLTSTIILEDNMNSIKLTFFISILFFVSMIIYLFKNKTKTYN